MPPDQPEAKMPKTDAEKLVWSHAYWARLNHESEKFIPTQARENANQVLAHAREMDLVEIMAGELESKRLANAR